MRLSFYFLPLQDLFKGEHSNTTHLETRGEYYKYRIFRSGSRKKTLSADSAWCRSGNEPVRSGGNRRFVPFDVGLLLAAGFSAFADIRHSPPAFPSTAVDLSPFDCRPHLSALCCDGFETVLFSISVGIDYRSCHGPASL